jgi:DnaJ-class molecular chaperone
LHKVEVRNAGGECLFDYFGDHHDDPAATLCPTCSGSGVEAIEDIAYRQRGAEICRRCHGVGKVTKDEAERAARHDAADERPCRHATWQTVRQGIAAGSRVCCDCGDYC